MTEISAQNVTRLETPTHEWVRDEYTISTDRNRLDLDMIHSFLHTSYWANGISRDLVQRGIDHSYCFGVFEGDKQIGNARVVTDFATFAYVCDFFISEPYRGRGLAKWLIRTILEAPEVAALRRRCIVTHEAHGLYRQMGFMSAQRPEAYLELVNKDAFK